MSQTTSGPVVRVTVWGENLHEKRDESVQKLYPDGMHTTIASGISEHLGDRAVVRTATLDQPEHGLTDEVLGATDVLTWWGHMGHGQVADVSWTGEATRAAGHGPRRTALGPLVEDFPLIDGDELQPALAFHWRARARLDRQCRPSDREGRPARFRHRLRRCTANFRHPSARRAVFISSFAGGEVFRSGCCFYRGAGRVFYFSPGTGVPRLSPPGRWHVIANGVVDVP